MKLHVLRFLVVMLVCASAAVVITTTRAQKARANRDQAPVTLSSLGLAAPSQTPSATTAQEPTVEQVEKNIKVLNGMPASQLVPVMNLFATSLGVRCNFCHVNNNGQWDYAADTKPEKNTAREMVKMVLDINKNSFRGNPQVSCFTCHRGRSQPQGLTLPLPMPSPRPSPAAGAGTPAAAAQASPNPTPAMPTADDIFNKYIAALGGQAAIDKLASRTAKGTISQANGNSFQFDLQQRAPDKFYLIVTTPQGTMERASSGQAGWEKTGRGVRDINGGELANLKAGNGLFTLIKLKDQYARPPRVRRDKLNDRDVYIVDGNTIDGKRMRLFFDADSGLLLRRVTWVSTMVGLIPEQIDLEDYREVDGVKFPFIARTSGIEAGNPMSTRTFTEIKVNPRVDETKFQKPAAPSPNP
ncbi:MAG: c-type cytochrome [Pyrinomonadaceae bacterium]